MFSVNNGGKLERAEKTKSQYTWKLNSTFLNLPAKMKLTGKLEYILIEWKWSKQINNPTNTISNFVRAAKAVLKGIFLSLTYFIKKESLRN